MRFSVLIEIYCGFAVLGNFSCGFSVSNRAQCPPPFGISHTVNRQLWDPGQVRRVNLHSDPYFEKTDEFSKVKESRRSFL